MNTRIADRIFRALFVFIFIFGVVGIPNTRVIAQSPLPQLTLEMSATPAIYGQAGDVINYSYLLTNTGSGALTGPFTVTDNKTVVTCPQNMKPVDLSNTVLFDHFENGNLAQYASGAPAYVSGPDDFGQAVDFSSGTWLRYNMPGWYQWPINYDPTGKAGSVDFWVYPKQYNMGLINLNWNYTNTVPGGGHILHMDIDANGKLTGQAWSSIYGPVNDPTHPVIQLPTGITTLPLNQWTHVAYTWGANGTRTFVNGIEDAFSPDNLYPALNASNYLYVPNWGVPGIGYIDDLRITSSSQTNFVVSALAQGESITCNGSYTITQIDIDNGSVTNTAQAHGFFGTTPVDSNQDTATVTTNAPHPSFNVWMPHSMVHGYGWPRFGPVTLTVDDSSTPASPDYTRTLNARPTSWDPSGMSVEFPLQGQFQLKAGQTVTMTSGTVTKTHTITDLVVSSFSAETNLVTGTAQAGTEVRIENKWNNSIWRHEVAAPDGSWTADFNVAGDETGEVIAEINPGEEYHIGQRDEDADGTLWYVRMPNPSFSALRMENQVQGHDWPLGTGVTLTIDDPDNGVGIDYTATQTVVIADWDPNQTSVRFDLGSYTLQSGQLITMTQGATTKTHVVTNLMLTQVDPVADTVSGTADLGTQVDVGHIYCNENGCTGFRRVFADVNGNWTADFAHVGEDNDEQDIIDIQAGTNSEARQCDTDGECTIYNWRVPDPNIEVTTSSQYIIGRGWVLGSQITLTIDSAVNGVGIDYTESTRMLPPQWDPNQIVADFDLYGKFTFAPGDVLTMTDGYAPMTYTVQAVDLTEINVQANTASGTGTPGDRLQVCVNVPEFCSIWRYVIVDGSGNWTTDFSVPGTEPDEQETLDILPGHNVRVIDQDEYGNRTCEFWDALNPNFSARLTENQVHGYEWPLGTSVTLTIDDPDNGVGVDYTDALTVLAAEWDPNQTFVQFDLGSFALESGQLVSMSQGGITKTHTVTNLIVTAADPVADTVSGTTNPGTQVDVGHIHCDENGCTGFRRVLADTNGNWTADFAHVGEDSDEQDIIDIRADMGSEARQCDDDGECTIYSWQVPNPTVSARANEDYIEGMGWAFGSTVTIEINDPATDVNPDYTGRATVGFADWDPNQTWFELDTNDYDVKAGDLVTGTSGNITKELLVSGYEITHFDLETEMVYGTAEPGQRVNIWTCWQSDPCVDRDETADPDGNWMTNFSIPGEQEWEKATADLQAGSWIDSSVSDEDGDSTMFGWGVSNPTLHAVPTYPEVHGHDWPAGTDVTLTIDDDTDPNNGVLYTRAKNADDDPWCGYPCFDLSDVFDLQIGQYVTMTDGVITKVVQVSTLKIMSVDLANERLSGVANPGSDVMVNIWSQDGKARHTVADANGNWLVDFSIFGDEDFEQFTTDITDEDNGRAIQLNPDGTDDGTLEYWPTLNNPPVANAGPDLADYAGKTFTLDASASSDPEAGALTYEWDIDNNGQYDDASGMIITASFNQVGDHIIGLRVTDDGGLSASDTVTVTVLPWTLRGFYQPVDMNGVFNITKNGSTVPFKFEIFAGASELTDVVLIKSVTYIQTSCDANATTDQIEVTSNEVTSLHYDAESGQFIYHWKTPKTAGKCYRVTMITTDGSSLLAYFKLK